MVSKRREAKNRYNDFFSNLGLAFSTKRKYRDALKSEFLVNLIQIELKAKSIFEVTDLESLWKFYCMINIHPVNVRMHRYYSTPLRKYISYLNGGKKYGRRIDFAKKRGPRNSDAR